MLFHLCKLPRLHKILFFKHSIRFIIVGLSNAIVSYITFFLLFNFIFVSSVFISQCIGYGTGIIWSFIWNKNWTFSENSRSWIVFFPFSLLQISLLLISALSMSILDSMLDININYIWFCVMSIITLINFITSKYIIFKA